jgi:hypothetical protein
MAKAPTIALKSEDFADLLADYQEADALLRAINRFGTGVSAALNRGLTLAENQCAQVVDVDVDGSAPTLSVQLKLPTGRKAQGVTVIYGRDITNRNAPTGIGGAPWVDWREDKGQVVIEGITGLTAAHKYTLRLLIWGN